MIPDIAAMTMAMIAVTTAMPPRVRDIHRLRQEYISRAMFERSRSVAINMKSGTDIST